MFWLLCVPTAMDLSIDTCILCPSGLVCVETQINHFEFTYNALSFLR